MLKSIVVFEGSDNGKLINKHVYAGRKNKCLSACLDFVFKSYDFDNITNIFFMVDGTSLIKAIPNEFKINNIINYVLCLDKFQFK